MLYLSDEEAIGRLSSPSNGVVRNLHRGGRKAGDVAIPPMIREIVGTVAHFDTIDNVAQQFGISPKQVKNIKDGRTTALNGKNEELSKKIENNVDDIKSKAFDAALDKTLRSLNFITDDTLAAASSDPEKMSKIAVNLSNVASKLSSRQEDSRAVNVTVLTVNQNTPDKYDLVTVDG